MSAATPRVVIACDKFKGSLTAAEVVAAISLGVKRAFPEATVRDIVAADGGDGTLSAAVAAGFSPVATPCTGPLGENRESAYAVREGTAVVEMADACGIVHVPAGKLAPLSATSRGLGDVIRAALDNPQVHRLVMGIGGSASTDGGAGMLTALGARLLDESGMPIGDGGGELSAVHAIDLAGLHSRLQKVDVVLASDVDNPLTGKRGAAAVFGPQKGATGSDVKTLDENLTKLVAACERSGIDTAKQLADAPGAGGAGGVGFAALAVLGATMRPGIELVLDLAKFDQVAKGADLVITGEGSLDEQSLAGKTPVGVSQAAARLGIPVIALCGRTTLEPERLQSAGIRAAYALLDRESDAAKCFTDAARLLADMAEAAAKIELS